MSNVSMLLQAVLGMAVAMGALLTLQGAVRKWRSSDRDALESMCHGCGGCKTPGSCHTHAGESNEKEEHHELG
jgi:hypothetical protein